MTIDFLLWGICFAVLWASHVMGKIQGRAESDILWETTIKKIVDENEDEFKQQFIIRLQNLKKESSRFKNE